MSDDWISARMIPTARIRGAEEQEARATSALLSVMTIVPSFAHAVLKHCGAPLTKSRGTVDAFVEVPFKDKDKGTCRPDGLIRVTRGMTVFPSAAHLASWAGVRPGMNESAGRVKPDLGHEIALIGQTTR